MPLDELPGKVLVATREELVERWKRSHRTRVPGADTGPGTQPDVDARSLVDIVLPVLAAAKMSGRNAVLEEARGKAADQWGEREGVGARRDAIGATGYVRMRTSTGGTTIQVGQELTHEPTGLRFEALETRNFVTGDNCAIIGKDTGPETNLAAGLELKWTSPPSGCGATAVIVQQSDGSGLSGGRLRESDEEYVDRIGEEKRTRAASGNDADYQIKAQQTPTVPVQKAFSYPGITGPGTICIVFTLSPLTPGGSRIPNPAQIGLVEAHVEGQMPADDGSFFGALLNQDADVVFDVTWNESAAGWEDTIQWPPYYAPAGSPSAVIVDGSLTPTATTFKLKTATSDYTSVKQPQVGQTIAFYEQAKGKFRRKRIGTIAGTGPWTVTCDVTNNVSDTSYIPIAAQRAMPWSDSLDSLLPGLFAYFDTLGPGEQVATFYDEGRRQKRIPRPPRYWPAQLTSKALTDAVATEDVDDVHVREGDNQVPTVGTPGVLSYILKLRYVAFFPES